MDLTWTAAAPTVDVERYQHRLSTDGGDTWRRDWTDIAGSDATTTSHTVGSLPDATTFTVELRIRAGTVRSAAARATARTANLPTNFMGRPGAPANLTLTLSDGCHVTMDWSAPASNGGTAITRYENRHRVGNRPFHDWQQDLGNPFTTELRGFFTCGVSYTYQFRAVNATGNGARAEITFTPRRSEPPFAPRDLAAAGGFQRVALSWETPPATFNRIDYYQVRYRPGAHPYTSWTRIPNSNYQTTRHTVTGLADETRYTIQVRAVNSEGGGASAQRGATTQALPVDAPSGFGVTAGIRKVDLAWTAAASTVAVEAYQYRLSTDGGHTWSRDWTDIAGSDATTTRHTVSRLANGTAYTVALRIRSGTARSAAASQSATTPDVPSAPGLRARPGDRRSITLTWTRRYDGGRSITKYQFRRTRVSPGFTAWATIPGSGANTTSYTHSDGLSDEGRKYTFEVRAVNAVGHGRAARVDGRTAVSGDPRQPTIRVWSALAREGRNAAVEFTVELHPAASSTVTVDYRTEDRSATAPADYQATSGTLTFARGEKEKTVSVPIVDDTVEDSGESFALLLSNVSGARLGVERTFGLIYNTEDVIAGFTLVDAASGTDIGSLTDGTEVTLDDPATGQCGVRVETVPEAAIGSLRLALSGAKTVARTDNAAPYTLYADGGEGLPPGAYTLQATAYPDPDGGGTALQTRSVSFTVAAATADEDDGAALSASFPASAYASSSHSGADDRPQVVVAFSEAVAAFAANTPSVQVTGGTISSVQAHTEDGLAHAWLFFLTPDGDGDVTFALVADTACTAGGLCTAGGTVLTEVPATLTIPGPEAAADDDADDDAEDDDDTDNADDTAPASLTAAFGEVPAEHDGQSAFNVRVEFSEDVGISYKALRDESFSVTDGDVTGARRVDGRHDLWEITVEPDSREAVTISLPGGSACGAAGAVCTRGDDPRPLSNSPSARVAGPPGPEAAADDDAAADTDDADDTAPDPPSGLSVADAEATEEEDAALDFVVTLDPAATAAVTVDYATADGTATAGSDYTATSGTLTFQPGETSKTVSVPITDDAVEDGGEILTLTLSGASGADLDDAEATGTIQNTETSLTASFEDVPSEHDGSTVFTFRLRFSEDPAVSYEVLRDRAFSVSGGTVKKARRVDGRNDLREIHVQPETTGEIRIDLPATTDCDAVDAICTEDGRPLSHSLSETIASPVGISVADARVDENGGAPLAFAVTLSRAAAGQVTVDYQTVNGTASAGTDYTAASGTLTFAAGDTEETVEVAVLDDSHDEGEETMTLRLSNPSEGRLADAEATGTIENTDPLPRALLARFGRATALHVMEQVEVRLEASRASGLRGRFAGRELRRGMERDMGRNFLSRLQSTAGAGARDTMGVQSDLSGSELLRTGLGGGDVLMGSGFVLNRETGGGASVSLWSRGMESRFSGRDGELSLDGGVRTTMFGADYAKGPLMAGLMLSHRRGLGGYQGADIGQVASSVTGLHPWVGYKLTERVTLWGVTGYGRGSLSLTPGEAVSLPTSLAAPVALKGGLSMSMLAGGVRGDLVDSGAGGFGLAFKADALWVGTGSEAVDGPAGRLAGTEAVVTRVRTALEASRGYVFGHGIALRPSFEVGLRRDGGDAETGVGADVAASLIASDPLTGLSVDVRVRTLLVHQDEGFRERGVSVSFSYDPTPQTPLGLTARVAPSWGGQAMSGADALWGRDTMEGLGAAGPGSGDRIDAELGYALPVGSRLVGTPRFGVTTSEYGRGYRLGYSLAVVQGGAMSFQFGLDAQRRESLGRGDADHSLVGRLTVGW